MIGDIIFKFTFCINILNQYNFRKSFHFLFFSCVWKWKFSICKVMRERESDRERERERLREAVFHYKDKFGVFSSWPSVKQACLFVPIESFSLILRRHHYWWRTSKFDLSKALIVIEQWRFISVPQLWHETSFYDGDLRGPWRAFGSGGFNTCFYDLCLSRLGFEHPTFMYLYNQAQQEKRRFVIGP